MHFQTFLECIHKYAEKLDIEFYLRVVPARDDVHEHYNFVLIATGPGEGQHPRRHTFVYRLRDLLTTGVFNQSIQTFRRLMSLGDIKHFFSRKDFLP